MKEAGGTARRPRPPGRARVFRLRAGYSCRAGDRAVEKGGEPGPLGCIEGLHERREPRASNRLSQAYKEEETATRGIGVKGG